MANNNENWPGTSPEAAAAAEASANDWNKGVPRPPSAAAAPAAATPVAPIRITWTLLISAVLVLAGLGWLVLRRR